MSRKITRFDVVLVKEIEIDCNLKEIGEPQLSAYLKADDGSSVWICYLRDKEDVLKFIDPEVFEENLNETLTEEELCTFVDNGLCCDIPYYFDGKEYYIK